MQILSAQRSCMNRPPELLPSKLDPPCVSLLRGVSPKPCILSIVAIHGLNGHPYGSWVGESTHRMWLLDYLPDDAEDCRIVLYGYRSYILDDQTRPCSELTTQAERLQATLQNIRITPEVCLRLKKPSSHT